MQTLTLPGPLVVTCDQIDVAVASEVVVHVEVVGQIDLAFRRIEAVLFYDLEQGAELLDRLAASGQSFHWAFRPAMQPQGHLLAVGPIAFDGRTLSIEVEAWGAAAHGDEEGAV
jgi:hypothetical protein